MSYIKSGWETNRSGRVNSLAFADNAIPSGHIEVGVTQTNVLKDIEDKTRQATNIF